MAGRLITLCRRKPDVYLSVRSKVAVYWTDIVLSCAGRPTRRGDAFTDVDCVLLATQAVFDLATLVSASTSTGPPVPAVPDRREPLVQGLMDHSPQIQGWLRECLLELGAAPDEWSAALLFGLLLHPLGVAWVRAPFNFGPRRNLTEVERGLEFAVEVPDTTYRTAGKVHRAYRRAHGVERKNEKSGPKPGGTRHPSPQRERFEAYVLSQSEAGAYVYSIAQDPKAQRLYRRARPGATAELSEQTVRRVLRKRRPRP